MGPYEMGGDWSDKGIAGTDRFVNRVYDLFNEYKNILNGNKLKEKYDLNLLSEEEKFIYRKTNQTLRKVEEETEHFRFNTAIAALMELLNNLKELSKCTSEIQGYVLQRFASMLSPLAPHLSEECWQIIGEEKSIFENPVWFTADQNALIEDKISIAVQVNGKLRNTIEIPVDSEQESVKSFVFSDEKVNKFTEGKTIVKEIFVKNKIYNIVVK
jgi:leucyl-tRNA synthetase